MDANWRRAVAEGFLAISVEPNQDQLEKRLESVYQGMLDRGMRHLAGSDLAEMLRLSRQRRELGPMLLDGQGQADTHSSCGNSPSPSESEHSQMLVGQRP